jgi:uncharacterized protein YbjT (DUF2867 family)
VNIVTGAFSYTGKYITRRLLEQGERVKTLTNHPNRPDPFAGRVSAAPFSFENPGKLVESLRGADVLFNTYWVRFGHGPSNFERAVKNSSLLFRCAREAGIRRVVHISIANASADSTLPYFRGKGRVEEALRASGLSYCILRPTVVFGDEDILINNMAWLLRKFPVFAIPGSGDYRLQPVFVEDVAELAVAAGHRSRDEILDAVGSEIFQFDELVYLISCAIGSRAYLARTPAGLSFLLSKLVGIAVRDKILTWEEVEGLMANLLISRGVPTGRTKFSEWLRSNAHHLGLEYAGELDRHFRGASKTSCPQCALN